MMTRIWALNSKLYGFCRNSFLFYCGQRVFPTSHPHKSPSIPRTSDLGYTLQTHQGSRSPSACPEATSPSFGLCIACLLRQSKAVCPSPFSLNGDSQKNQLYIGLYRAGNRMERRHIWGGSSLLNPGSKIAGKPKAKATFILPAPSIKAIQLWDSHTCLVLASDQHVPIIQPSSHPSLHLSALPHTPGQWLGPESSEPVCCHLVEGEGVPFHTPMD